MSSSSTKCTERLTSERSRDIEEWGIRMRYPAPVVLSFPTRCAVFHGATVKCSIVQLSGDGALELPL